MTVRASKVQAHPKERKGATIMKRITFDDVKELAGCVVFGLLVWLLFWIYLIVTPDQYSAECEALRYEMEQAEGGAK